MSSRTVDVIVAHPERQVDVGAPLPEEPQDTHHRGLLVLLAVAAVILIGAAVFRSRTTPSTSSNGQERTATVVRGDFLSALRLSGTTEAVKSFPIFTPRLTGEAASTLTIVRLVAKGALVKRGDLLVEFDRQNELKNEINNRAKYLDLLRQLAKQQANESAARAKDETDVQTAEDQLKTAQLEMQRLEILSRIDQEKTRNQLEQARASLKELQQTFKLRRETAAAGLRDLELQRDQAKRDMLHSQQNAERMAIHSPLDGVVVLHTIWRSGQFTEVQEGDQIRPGQVFMEVVNPSGMQVQVKASQMDLLRLHPGQHAEVRLDAYPGLSLAATLDSISPVGSRGQFSDKLRTFLVTFSVQGQDPRLMPDLSAAVDVELDQRKDALRIPKDFVYTERAQSYVHLKTALGYVKRAVARGPENNLEVVIESGLNAGDVVERAGFGS